MKSNPKTHDSLFKWLITSFTKDFFDHYFPNIKIGTYGFIDKEFISKYEALKESLEGDLFLIMEVDIDMQMQEIVIQIEHQSQKKDVSKRVFEYCCYAWLLKMMPVWSIVIYTDDAKWKESVTDRFYYAYASQNEKQYHYYDVIKVNAEKSSDLIKKHSLLCKLLALKANDEGMNPEQIILELYQTVSKLEKGLTNEQLLLIEQWVRAYKKVTDQKLNEIKKEISMSYVETTISEHYINQGKKAEKIEIAKKMLKKGSDIDFIIEVTGLTKEESEKLQKEV